MSGRCPSCGATSSGKFCSSCGAPLGPRACAACGKSVAAGAKFCAACGTPVVPGVVPGPATPAAERSRSVVPIVVAGVAILTAVLVFVLKSQPAAGAADGASAPFAAQGGDGGGLPDLSTMTPREQFDRLYNRVMQASEQGDTATANRFSPMALQAYLNLPEVDQDARYHAAMIKLHGGDLAGAQALADTIGTLQKGHLFGYVLNAAIARFGQDQQKLQRSYQEYLSNLDAEMKAGRAEYLDHKTMLDNFTQAARQATGKTN